MSVLLRSPWVLSLGWALLHFIWQGALLALILQFLLQVIRQSSSRYLISCAALALCLLLPCGTAVRQFQACRDAGSRQEAASVPKLPASDRLEPPVGSVPSWKHLEASIQPRLPQLVGFWLLGCAVMAIRLSGGWFLILGWSRQGMPPPGIWTTQIAALSKRMNLRRPVRLRVSDRVDSPLTLGFWRPVVLVPASLFTGMAPELLEALLLHELAHIRRHDYLANLLQVVSELILFYHPAVWWISRRIRIERELLADELAAKVLGEPRRLALALDALDDLQPLFQTPAIPARGGQLMHRIHCLLNPAHDSRRTRTPFAWVVPLLLSGFLLAPLAAAIVQGSKQKDPRFFAPAALVQRLDALADREGIDPALLRAIAWTESRFNPDVVSGIGAKGILQVLPETAQRFGATDLDDPAQVEASGARYLKSLLDRYQGDRFKAVSAYNAGATGFEAGKLRPETPAYVKQVLWLAESNAVQPDTYPATIPSGLPIPGARITLGFGRHVLSDSRLANSPHRGLDLRSPLGTLVQATADGVVAFAGQRGGFGITVVLRHGDGLETLYAHLAKASVKEGQFVSAGTAIGTVGRTGKTTGPHVHYEVNKDGAPMNPSTYLAQ